MHPALLRRREPPFAIPRVLRVSRLPDPSEHTGERRVFVGSTDRNVYSDGTNWIDIADGSTVDPWWLPADAVLHVDFDNSRFYWDGATKVIGDLTAEGVGGYSLAYGFGFSGTAWVDMEYSSANDLSDWSGCPFSWSASGNRVEFDVSNNGTYGDGLRLYCAPGNPTADYQAIGATSKDGEAGAVYIRDERRRFLTRIASNSNHQFQPENGDLRDGTKGAGALVAPTKLGFGLRAAFTDQPLTNATLHRVTLYNTDLSDAQVASIGRSGDARPVHLIGDSFLNNYGVGTRFMQICSNAGKAVPFSQDGVGGTTLLQQAARYAAYAGTEREKWWDSTLVICEFGAENSSDDQIDAIKNMLAHIKHDKWIYMQPAPSSTLDPVTSLPEKDAAMKAWMGDDHFVSTLPEAWAESDLSQADEDQIALGRWPVSLTISAADFHPNDAGQQFIAQRIYDALVARGWI